MRKNLELFRTFFIVGATLFGGGYAVIPMLESELVRKRGWLTMDEVMDFFTISQITPGVIAVNIATFVGCRRNGIAGGAASTIGMVLPGVTLMLIVSLFVERFADYPVVQHALAGIRVAVCALVIQTSTKLIRGFYRSYKALVIFCVVFVLSAVFSVSPVFIILGAGFMGFMFFAPEPKKGKP